MILLLLVQATPSGVFPSGNGFGDLILADRIEAVVSSRQDCAILIERVNATYPVDRNRKCTGIIDLRPAEGCPHVYEDPRRPVIRHQHR
jgi:hypothetical protein